MSTLSNAGQFRRKVAGLCMIGAPALFLAGSIISPKLDTDEGTLLSNAASHIDRWYLSTVLVFAGFVLFLPALFGLMHMLRERGAVYGNVGGALALLGLVSAIANAGMSFVIWQMARGGDPAQMTALLKRINDTAGTAVPLLFMGLALSIGLIVLAWGLMSAHAAPTWCAMCIALAAVGYALGGPMASAPVFIAASALLMAGLAPIGRMILAETDEEWEHTPEVRGFFPAVGAH
jgi:hypothetical protein